MVAWMLSYYVLHPFGSSSVSPKTSIHAFRDTDELAGDGWTCLCFLGYASIGTGGLGTDYTSEGPLLGISRYHTAYHSSFLVPLVHSGSGFQCCKGSPRFI